MDETKSWVTESDQVPTKKPKTGEDIKSLCRAHTATAVSTLAGIMRQPKAQVSARIAAAQALLDRGWGRAAQVMAAEEGGPPKIIIEYRDPTKRAK